MLSGWGIQEEEERQQREIKWLLRGINQGDVVSLFRQKEILELQQ